MDNKLMKKAKQAGRREARQIIKDHVLNIEPGYVVEQYLKPKPKYLLKFIWTWLVSRVLKLKATDQLRVALTGKDYHRLVSGEVVFKNGVQFVLKDIGFAVMRKILSDVEKRND